MKIIEKKASKPHTVYHCGGRLQLSYAITIPKPFALEMGLDEEDSYVLSHLVIASDEGNNSSTVDFTAEQAAEKVIMSPPGNDEKKRKRTARKFSHSEHSKGKRVYLVVEKLIT